MNQLMIIGGLTKDPDTRTTREGKQVCTFNVGVNRRNDRDTSDYFRVSAWGKLADSCGRYLAKGMKVCVIGQVSVSMYETNSGEKRAIMDVYAETVEFLSRSDKNDQKAVKTTEAKKESEFVQVDEEIPF